MRAPLGNPAKQTGWMEAELPLAGAMEGEISGGMVRVALCCVPLTTWGTKEDRSNTFARAAPAIDRCRCLPLTEGYVYRSPVNSMTASWRVPGQSRCAGCSLDLIKTATRGGARDESDLVTLWTGANDLVNGDDPKQFRRNCGAARRLAHCAIVVANHRLTCSLAPAGSKSVAPPLRPSIA
jgi:hypothetical protein